jgi:hypothetical protein
MKYTREQLRAKGWGRRFVAYFWYTGWSNLSFGVNIDLAQPNIEIHLPVWFFRIGWIGRLDLRGLKHHQARSFGYGVKR